MGAVIIHALNNTFYLIEQYRAYGLPEEATAYDGNLLVMATSLLLTSVGIFAIYKVTHPKDDYCAPAA